MNAKEVAGLLAMCAANFPAMGDRDLRLTARLWELMLEDVPFDVGKQAICKVLATARFFPTVGEIRQAVAELQSPRLLDWSEAWGLIRDAIRRYGAYRESEALASLPPDVRKVVQRFGWQNLCLSEEIEVVRGQFRMAWETYAKRETERAALPLPIREQLDGVARRLALSEGSMNKGKE